MKRRYKIAIWSIGLITILAVSIWFSLFWRMSKNLSSTVESHVMTKEEFSQRFGSDVQVFAGFQASEYGGWHGDGGSIEIFLVDPSDTQEIIVGLKKYHEEMQIKWPGDYNYEWSKSSRPDLNSLDRLIPEEFQPSSGVYVIGRNRSINHTISIDKKKGYVCFSDSRD